MIFLFSAQPATKSNELSTGFTRVLIEILGKILPVEIETSTIIKSVGQLNHYIRKFAHFSVYLVLGILVWRALTKSKYKNKKFITALIICVIYAATDELHQLFVPGRGGQLKDVFIDSLGALVGITLSEIMYKLKRKQAQQT